MSTIPSSPPAIPQQLDPHQYTGIIHSIQRRSTDRASTGSISSNDANTTSTTPNTTSNNQQQLGLALANTGKDPATLLSDLDQDLRLSAQIGVALLEDKANLERRLATSEQANQKLLDRLTASVKESSQLQRRLEEAVGNLEQAESNNRALLIALEEDRKRISRLTADAARLTTAAAQLKNLTRSHEDMKQELVAEQRRSNAAEARVKKQSERVGEMEDRLRRAIEDLEEMRQDKVLRSRKSQEALSKVRLKLLASSVLGEGGVGNAADNAELLKLVESLANENELLRSESLELHEMLELSRDEQSGLRSAMANRSAFVEDVHEEPEEDELECEGEGDGEGHQRRPKLPSRGTLLSEVMMSPSVSTSFSDFDRPSSPASTNPTSFSRSWGRGLARTNSSRSTSPGRIGGLDDTLSRFGAVSFDPSVSRGPGTARRRGAAASQGMLSRSTGPVQQPSSASGVVPFGRGHSRRAMSMDVTSYGRRASGDLSHLMMDRPPTSPTISAPYSPSISGRPESIRSVATDDDARPRRSHHRPLSLSLGPSLFPLVPEDGQSPSPSSGSTFPNNTFTKRHRSSASVSMSVSRSTSSGGELPTNPSGLSLSSPTRKRTSRGFDDGNEEDRMHQGAKVLVTVDSATQTSPPPATPTNPRFGSRLRHDSPRGRGYGGLGVGARGISPSGGFETPPPSDLSVSEGDSQYGLGIAASASAAGLGAEGHRTTQALGSLIEHAAKLLVRVQSADVVTLEKRLKKQNLPGDVRHLAQANLKELVNDIEGIRTHFRRVLENERVSTKDSALSPESSQESHVLRRDFVSLVKLFRDLLFETSRLRSLVNRVQLEPSLASSLRELDTINSIDNEASKATSTAAGLLAPFSRLFNNVVGTTEEPVTPPPPVSTPRPSIRPIAKLTGSSAVTSAVVNVEFGSGAVRRAVASRPGEEGSPDLPSPSQRSQTSLTHKKSDNQVRRDLSSIFAGGLPAPRSPTGEPWVVVSNKARPTPSSNPLGCLLAAYRPAVSLSTTTNAVLDSFAQARPEPSEPTLLERQLRPRGLSDSSIRSTFIAHANPQHRLLSPATLALSSEGTSGDVVAQPISISIGSGPDGSSCPDLREQLTVLSTSMRKPSIAKLRKKDSRGSSLSRSHTEDPVDSEPPPPVPSLPISISASPKGIDFGGATHAHHHRLRGDGLGPVGSAPQGFGPAIVATPPPATSGSLFNNLSHWASRATGLSGVTGDASAPEDDGSRKGRTDEWTGPSSLGQRGDSWARRAGG
ncbi:hypothetical protein T439DRAFT_379835 [Meredithblackwellia eburnea MCA 4105]